MPTTKTTKYNNPLGVLDSNELTANAQEYSFPKDELLSIDHWVTFRAFETTQLNRRESSRTRVLSYISLPLPGNLSTTYNIGYADADLGAMGQTLVDAFGTGQAANDARDIVRSGLLGAGTGGIVAGITSGDIAGGMVGGMTGAIAIDAFRNPQHGVGGAVASEVLKGETAGAVLAQSGGLARNPHKVLLFQGVGFRTHQFNYQFTPKSYDEAETLRKITRLFKYYGSPSFNAQGIIRLGDATGGGLQNINVDASAGKHFFKYPEYFEIDFHHPKFLFKIGPSVLESVSIDYHPAGAPTYARSKGREPTPTQMNISLHFRETEIVTKENILSENR